MSSLLQGHITDEVTGDLVLASRSVLEHHFGSLYGKFKNMPEDSRCHQQNIRWMQRQGVTLENMTDESSEVNDDYLRDHK